MYIARDIRFKRKNVSY